MQLWKRYLNEVMFVLKLLNYFIIKDAKFDMFYLLLKIRPVISNCRYYTVNIYSFGFPFTNFAEKLKLYIKDIKDIKAPFLFKLT